MATHNSSAATAAAEELNQARTKIEGLCNRVNELEASYNAANVSLTLFIYTLKFVYVYS